MQDERLIRLHFDEVREVWLVLRRIDERVLVVVEEAEIPIEAHVDARRLDHLRLVRVEADSAGGKFCSDVAVAEKHGSSVWHHSRARNAAPTIAARALNS